mmetsp:Transcript_11190/g.39678  ORF Transcript_11190/g.39678 Transcript_11190/m.39678 type:complete len:415 (-) Transcript_11190:2665-3909(-)
MAGSSATPKRVQSLSFNRRGCIAPPPPSAQCAAPARRWGRRRRRWVVETRRSNAEPFWRRRPPGTAEPWYGPGMRHRDGGGRKRGGTYCWTRPTAAAASGRSSRSSRRGAEANGEGRAGAGGRPRGLPRHARIRRTRCFHPSRQRRNLRRVEWRRHWPANWAWNFHWGCRPPHKRGVACGGCTWARRKNRVLRTCTSWRGLGHSRCLWASWHRLRQQCPVCGGARCCSGRCGACDRRRRHAKRTRARRPHGRTKRRDRERTCWGGVHHRGRGRRWARHRGSGSSNHIELRRQIREEAQLLFDALQTPLDAFHGNALRSTANSLHQKRLSEGRGRRRRRQAARPKRQWRHTGGRGQPGARPAERTGVIRPEGTSRTTGWLVVVAHEKVLGLLPCLRAIRLATARVLCVALPTPTK